MENKDIILITGTYYPKDNIQATIRSELAISLLKNAGDLGIKSIVAEGGSTNEIFIKNLTKLNSEHLKSKQETLQFTFV